MDIEAKLREYNIVKFELLKKMIEDDIIDKDTGNEVLARCQIVIFKGKWYSSFFKKFMGDKNIDGYYIRIVDFVEKESEIDRLMRRTNGGDDDDL